MQATLLLREIHQMEVLSQGISESINVAQTGSGVNPVSTVITNCHHILDGPEGPVSLSFTDVLLATGIAFQNMF